VDLLSERAWDGGTVRLGALLEQLPVALLVRA
jgi:hypothetical protein